ncbi:MAG: hypothetical protein MUE37_13110 [Bacteroidales bacterium]|jgi:hypothetical protein|nr:hypothetical protein [Bacteroidales bacterium]
MKRTLDINIAGQLFRIDEDAWEILKNYLDHVSARFKTEQGGDETVQDIEARIAEIFGGGNEPPTLVSKEMVTDMINIMGAPEEFYDAAPPANDRKHYTRKSMYDPNSLSARFGRALSAFFRAFGRLMSAIIRVFAVIFGAIFTLTGFLLFFTFAMLLFFSNAPFITSVMEPEIINSHSLLGIVLNSNMVWPVLILAALTILIPLGALTWLGVKLIFNIRERFRLLGIITFLVWIASLCALGVFLGLQLSVYAERETVEQRISLNPAPETIWITSMKKQADLVYGKSASVDGYRIFLNSPDDRLRASVDLNIYGTEDSTSSVSVERMASSNNDSEARAYARKIDYNWKFSGDTLYLDEYFSLPAGERWNGSMVDIDLGLPEGTEVRMVPGTSPDLFHFRVRNPDAGAWRIREGYLRELNE